MPSPADLRPLTTSHGRDTCCCCVVSYLPGGVKGGKRLMPSQERDARSAYEAGNVEASRAAHAAGEHAENHAGERCVCAGGGRAHGRAWGGGSGKFYARARLPKWRFRRGQAALWRGLTRPTTPGWGVMRGVIASVAPQATPQPQERAAVAWPLASACALLRFCLPARRPPRCAAAARAAAAACGRAISVAGRARSASMPLLSRR